MTLSPPMASAGVSATALTGLTGLLLLIGGVGDATAQTGLISGSVCSTSGPIAGIPYVAAANGRVVAAVAVATGDTANVVVRNHRTIVSTRCRVSLSST